MNLLTGREAQESIERLQPTRKIEKGEMGLPPVPTLGYRGLIIEQTNEPVKGIPKVFRFAHGSMFAPVLPTVQQMRLLKILFAAVQVQSESLDLGKNSHYS